MGLVNTANSAINSFDVDSYTGAGAICTVGNVIFDLDVGDSVWVIVLQTTGFAQTVRLTGTTFSIEPKSVSISLNSIASMSTALSKSPPGPNTTGAGSGNS